MFHLIYSLMFSDNKDARIWENVVESTLFQDDVLPMTYYKPFKYSWFYLKENVPGLNLEEYIDRFYYSERYFNASQFDQVLVSHPEYHRMKCFLNQKVMVFPVVFQTFNNLMNMNFIFNDEKLIIQYHPEFKCRRSNGMPSAMQKLPSKLMRYEGWEVLDLAEKEFNNWNRDDKINNVKGWLLEARAKQAEKGVCPKEINAKPL
uniref:Uncharacterized protein n=1 Tax=Strombidium inclinatum TaxID=197538 RepID=A0A7S3IRH5_9SPIT|mmetsp:Transcript_32964/g.50422  ORF Transcript_32964/g.50422 Transcript_32964/m.50422 type:complete len:204 (+) Transcript_32964:1538-2149(+)